MRGREKGYNETMKKVFIVFLCLALTACADDWRKGVHRLMNEVKGTHDEENPIPAVSRYCYKSIAATECYTQPQAGMEERLVGYQEPLVKIDQVYDRQTQAPEHLDLKAEKAAKNKPKEKLVLMKTATAKTKATTTAGGKDATKDKDAAADTKKDGEVTYDDKVLKPRRLIDTRN